MRGAFVVRMGVLAVAALAAFGCATITKGTTQVVSVDTPGAPGAKCLLASSSIGQVNVVTPATVNLQKGSENVVVRCSKECFNDGTGIIGSNTEAMAAGNLIAGGIIGLGIDAASGAMNKYNEQDQIAMVPVPGCRLRG
ncbi:MAG: hypothetical protein ACKVP7_28245 [Hyphomicrobiaceae bacterium]